MGRFLQLFSVLTIFFLASPLSASEGRLNLQLNTAFYENDSIASTLDRKFLKKYNALVARAYFKLIVEAERADIRLGKDYMNVYAMSEENLHNEGVQEEFTKVYHRFLTHRRMLSGLKSWRIFSENRTGDLEYFKAEYRKTVYLQYQNKASDHKMIVFLMYKLADLYHHAD